jgi:hypothetical protein
MPNFYQKHKTKIFVSGIIFVVILSTVTAYLLVKKSSEPNEITKDPSAANDERIKKEQEEKQKLTITPTQTVQETQEENMGDANSTNPTEKGKALAGGNCSGTGSKKLSSAPMNTEQMSIIVPYGLLAGGHVTPIDHQYYWGKEQNGAPDMYDVLAPGDGKLVELQYRNKENEGKLVKGDYRGVIMYSCTFFSYFDLATSLSADIQSQLPSNWEHTKGNINTNIEVKAGQIIGKVGSQSLDFAIWDTTKNLPHLLVPIAYNNAESWKINTVPPMDYFTDEVKAKILPFYANQSKFTDGTIDQDIDGEAAGSWFLEGTNGYAGVFEYGANTGGQSGYWSGHLSFAHDLYDDTSWVFSKGDIGGTPQQFGIKSSNTTITPDKLSTSSGIVKYDLIQWAHMDENGQGWFTRAPAKSIKMSKNTPVKGTVLIQMLEDRKIKVEVFMGKTSTQVSKFTSAAQVFTRGDGAKMIVSNTAQ